jgi:TRAP-type mannitol/chloroaromatic compound transport system substrate-binding protein
MRITLAALLCLILVSCGGESSKTDATAEAQPTQTYNWKLVTTWPKNFPGLGLAPEHFAENVQRMSNGRLKIKVFGAGQLVPAFEVFDASMLRK